jgi:hypothetical protein
LNIVKELKIILRKTPRRIDKHWEKIHQQN